MTGITRVSLKKRDGLIFVINDPEVLKSGTNENSYAIFGELRLEDPNSRLTQTEAKKFTEAKPTTEAPKAQESKEEDKAAADDSVPLSEEGLTPHHIDMVMQHANCSRNTAITVLRESNDDMVTAVMKLTK
jgi:nascent polypeptide-associated complex subunit alpha